MTNHNINFSGASIGGVNIDSTVEGNQIGTQSNCIAEKNLTQAAQEIQDLLAHLQQTNSTDIQATVHNEIRTNPTFYDRLYFMLQAGSLETLKTIFPPLGIPIEMVRAWVEAKPIEPPPTGGLPPSGF
jgi:hypothetical protein